MANQEESQSFVYWLLSLILESHALMIEAYQSQIDILQKTVQSLQAEIKTLKQNQKQKMLLKHSKKYCLDLVIFKELLKA